MTLVHVVEVPRLPVSRLEPVIGAPRYAELTRGADQVRQVLARRTIWNVNFGGSLTHPIRQADASGRMSSRGGPSGPSVLWSVSVCGNIGLMVQASAGSGLARRDLFPCLSGRMAWPK